MYNNFTKKHSKSHLATFQHNEWLLKGFKNAYTSLLNIKAGIQKNASI